MATYAIVEASGKQFWIEEKRFYDFGKLSLNQGEKFTLNNILLVNFDNQIVLGDPFINKDYTVNATVLRHISGPKTRVYKMKPKKKTRKTFGFRKPCTRVFINSIDKK